MSGSATRRAPVRCLRTWAASTPTSFALDLVECLSLVARRFPDVGLVPGTGALSKAMQDRAAQSGVHANLRLLGSLPLDELPALLASSDAVVAPHMGYTLIEAG